MSTRATVHFTDKENNVCSIIYVHSDGYPEGLGKDIETFLKEKIEYAPDVLCFEDPEYLAAHFLCWKLSQIGMVYDDDNWHLRMTGVAPVMKDPLDIEYRYILKCSSHTEKPTVVCQDV